MRDKELQDRICQALDAEMSGMRVSPYLQDRILDNAIGGVKVKPKLTFGLVLTLVLVLITAAAVAVTVALLTPQEVVEQVAVPMARQNDKDWRVETDFSPEELAAFIQTLGENGFTLDENNAIMEAIRNGEGYDEEETIMAICREAFGGNYGSWTIAQKHWFWDVMIDIGWAAENSVVLPGPDDLPEAEARARMIAALKEKYGEDIGIEDRALYEVELLYSVEPGDDAVWHMSCWEKTDGGTRYFATMDKDGNILSAYDVPTGAPGMDAAENAEPVYTLTEDEAKHLAAEAIRRETGVADAPLEDPAMYRWFVNQMRSGKAQWHINFISLTVDGGFCSTVVDDATGEVQVESADVGAVTTDNLLARYRAAHGWYDTWDSTVWAEVAAKAAELPVGTTMEGKVTKATPWIAWREGLLTRDEAEEKAFRQAGVKMGDVNCVSLIDAQPHPIWKFRILPWDGTYQDSIVVEIDAVTGEMTDLDLYKSDHSDLEPSIHMVTLRSIWSKLEFEENGPLYIARLAVLHKFGDNTLDMPETDLPIFDIRYWKPEVRGNTVRFVSQWSDLPDYEVTLDENGMAIEAKEAESSGAEPLPEGLQLESIDESMYEINHVAMAEAAEKYGVNSTLWPLDVQMEVYKFQERTVPREGEMTLEEAVAFARSQLPEEAAYAENATVGAILYRLDEGTDQEFTRWTIYFYEDPEKPEAWRVTFVDKHPADMEYLVDVKEPDDFGNG